MPPRVELTLDLERVHRLETGWAIYSKGKTTIYVVEQAQVWDLNGAHHEEVVDVYLLPEGMYDLKPHD